MRARDAIVVMTDRYQLLILPKAEISERLMGGAKSAEVIDFGRDMTGVYTIVRTRHEKDDAACAAARELKCT